MKKKICFIAQFPPPIHGLSKAIDTLYNSELSKEFDFEKVDIKNNKKFLQNLFRILKSDADLFYFTISQSRGGNLRDLIIMKLLDLRKKKCLIHLHGGYYRHLVDNDLPKWQRKANYKAISKLAGAIVLGPSLHYIFEGMLPGDKIFTVPNCVDDEYLMSEEDFEKKIRTSPQQKIKHVLYLSNFIPSKGYREVLELVKLEKERVAAGGEKKFHFDFAGAFFDKSEKDYFENYIKNNNLENFVTYHGIVSNDAKQNLLEICDFFILLTKYSKEGQPISILEAMGNGEVIISTLHAGIPDEVENHINGIVIDKDNINVSNIYDDILNFSNYESVSIQNFKKVNFLFSKQNYINKLHNCFLSCL